MGKGAPLKRDRGMNPLATDQVHRSDWLHARVRVGKGAPPKRDRGINPLATIKSTVATGFMPGTCVDGAPSAGSTRSLRIESGPAAHACTLSLATADTACEPLDDRCWVSSQSGLDRIRISLRCMGFELESVNPHTWQERFDQK